MEDIEFEKNILLFNVCTINLHAKQLTDDLEVNIIYIKLLIKTNFVK